jgi:glycosyltransferase involved in cell wall biosynthesis
MRPDVPPADDDNAAAPRRIALCGSMRMDEWQWREFLDALGGIPRAFELLAFVNRAAFFPTPLPPNVRLQFQPYAATEADLVEHLADAGVWACYLGMSRHPADEAFSLYSFSSKLTAYAAAGLPSLVDAPAASAVWSRVREYDAGLLFDASADSRRRLAEFFANGAERRRLGGGALRLCRERFDLDEHARRFVAVLSRHAGNLAA